MYEFRNYCTHDRELELGDQTAKIFLNAQGNRNDISQGLKEFLDYVAGKENESPSEFIGKLENALYCAKQNREWRRERMIMYFRDMDIRADALKEGQLEGERKKEREMIRSMLANGASREFVKQVASITDEELDNILADNN